MPRNNFDKNQGDSPFTFHGNGSVPEGSSARDLLNAPEGDKKKKAKGERAKKERSVSVPGMADVPSASQQKQKSEVEQLLGQQEKKSSLDSKTRLLVGLTVLAVVLCPLLTILPIGVFEGTVPMSPALIIESTANNITGFANWITGGPVTSGISIVFWQMLAAGIVGASLALSGCVYQSALNNALASPSTLGVTSGGTLGTLIYTLLFGVPTSVGAIEVYRASEVSAQLQSLDVFSYFVSVQGRALCSLAGCFLIVGLIMTISHIAGRGKVSKVALLIAGQVFASVIAGVVAVIHSYINFYGTQEQIEAMQYVTGGSITSITGPLPLSAIAVPFILGVACIMFMRFKLNALSFSEDEARTMGVNTGLISNIAIVICTALTGVVISFVGAVGFVGFIVPHIARKVVGPNLRHLIPASIIIGAIFLMLTNYFMNMTGFLQGAIGTFTSIVGAVFFLIVIIKERRNRNVQWI